MMNSRHIEQELEKLGFCLDLDKVRVHKATRVDIEHPFYIKTSGSRSDQGGAQAEAPLVLHSDYGPSLKSDVSELEGVFPKFDRYYHNSNMKGFELRVHTGMRPTHYGIPIDIHDAAALSRLVDWINGCNEVSKPYDSELGDIEGAQQELDQVCDTERTSLVRSRLGQGKFRDDLLDYWKECAVSGVSLPAFLRASHIKPWRDCTNSERLDKYNGFLLNTTLDAAFDRGLISFSDDGGILISSALQEHAAELSISDDMSLRWIDERHLKYLGWHRRHVFESTSCQHGSETQ